MFNILDYKSTDTMIKFINLSIEKNCWYKR